MKSRYTKPEYSILQLRAEEKLAACDYPIAYLHSMPVCKDKTYLSYTGADYDLCKSLISGNTISGS